MVRRSSTVNFERIAHIQDRITFVPGDLLDEVSMINMLRSTGPHEVYNLAAQSFVQTSFGQPVLTGEITGLGVTRMLDAIRIVDPDIRFYQASSSRDVRQGAGGPADGDHAVLPPQPVRRGQGLRPLDHGQLPRELRPARQLRHPVQPREPAPRPRVRHPQDHPHGGPDQARPARTSCGSATSTRSATGASPATTSRRCGSCSSRTSPTTTSSRPARRTRCASSARSRSATSASTGEQHVVVDERFMRPAEVDLLVGDRRRPGPSSAGSRRRASRSS